MSISDEINPEARIRHAADILEQQSDDAASYGRYDSNEFARAQAEALVGIGMLLMKISDQLDRAEAHKPWHPSA